MILIICTNTVCKMSRIVEAKLQKLLVHEIYESLL